MDETEKKSNSARRVHRKRNFFPINGLFGLRNMEEKKGEGNEGKKLNYNGEIWKKKKLIQLPCPSLPSLLFGSSFSLFLPSLYVSKNTLKVRAKVYLGCKKIVTISAKKDIQGICHTSTPKQANSPFPNSTMNRVENSRASGSRKKDTTCLQH